MPFYSIFNSVNHDKFCRIKTRKHAKKAYNIFFSITHEGTSTIKLFLKNDNYKV